jgi:hypothetical protein
MKIIFGNPGSGKTKALLEMSAKNNIPVLCESAARVQRLLVKAEGYGFKIPAPLTVDEIDSSVPAVYIDDIKRVLEIVLNIRLAGITVNRDDDVEVIDLDVK